MELCRFEGNRVQWQGNKLWLVGRSCNNECMRRLPKILWSTSERLRGLHSEHRQETYCVFVSCNIWDGGIVVQKGPGHHRLPPVTNRKAEEENCRPASAIKLHTTHEHCQVHGCRYKLLLAVHPMIPMWQQSVLHTTIWWAADCMCSVEQFAVA